MRKRIHKKITFSEDQEMKKEAPRDAKNAYKESRKEEHEARRRGMKKRAERKGSPLLRGEEE